MDGWTETCRGIVAPWECDITEHFTIAYYFDRLADAASITAESLGLVDKSVPAACRFDVRVARELRAGASFHILRAPRTAKPTPRFRTPAISQHRPGSRPRPASRSAAACPTGRVPRSNLGPSRARPGGSSRRAAAGENRPIPARLG